MPMIVSVALALSLAHRLELPGKLRLDQEAYVAMQAIYYPGFTFGGLVGELGGMICLAILLYLVPVGNLVHGWSCLHSQCWLRAI